MPSMASTCASSSASVTRRSRGRSRPYESDVLSEQGDLAHAVGRKLLDLGHGTPPSSGSPRGRGWTARCNTGRAVAAHADLHPAVELPGTFGRQVSGETLELKVTLCGQRVAGQEFGELVDLTRAKGDIDEREAGEHLLLDRLRPASADPDDPAGILAFQPLRLAEVRVNRSSAFSRIEQVLNRIRSASARDGASAYPSDSSIPFIRSESCACPDLTPEGGHVVELHRV